MIRNITLEFYHGMVYAEGMAISPQEAEEMLEELKQENALPNASALSRPSDLRVNLPKSGRKPSLDEYDERPVA